jgi:hypothetical protein
VFQNCGPKIAVWISQTAKQTIAVFVVANLIRRKFPSVNHRLHHTVIARARSDASILETVKARIADMRPERPFRVRDQNYDCRSHGGQPGLRLLRLQYGLLCGIHVTFDCSGR